MMIDNIDHFRCLQLVWAIAAHAVHAAAAHVFLNKRLVMLKVVP
jgi:hypothetical protein